LKVRKTYLTLKQTCSGLAMKSTLKITSKGQVTFRKKVLDQLGVGPGDLITVELVGPGRVEVRSARPGAALTDFVGCLKKADTRRLSLEEMTKIAREGWAGGR
jgi:antitoxin PrlF